MAENSLLVKWAIQALACYPIASPSIQFLRHSDNLTFKITQGTDDKKFVLRIHKPFTRNLADLRQQPRAILSELLWMDALAKDAGIPVPPVVRNNAGQLITSVQLSSDGQIVPCSMLGWLDAEPYRPDAPEIENLAMQLGRLMARMHTHASQWQPPEGFLRPRSGPEHILQIMDKLLPGIQMGIIQPEDYSVIKMTAEKIRDIVITIDRTPENWSLIHNDLHTGNWLYRGEKVFPIDFSLCGYRVSPLRYRHCAGSLGSENPALRRSFINGYLEKRNCQGISPGRWKPFLSPAYWVIMPSSSLIPVIMSGSAFTCPIWLKPFVEDSFAKNLFSLDDRTKEPTGISFFLFRGDLTIIRTTAILTMLDWL